ncbi:MAG: hypothetical protein ABI479_03150, partial [Gallionella sp.]
MRIASLSTEQAPPISVPLRYFAMAPLFLVLAALMLAKGGSDSFADIHSPALLAATHCITLGFITMIMLGATQQILPVLIGSPMPGSGLVAWLTLVPLIAGTLLLSAGFMLSKPELLDLSWPLLGWAFMIFIVASLISLARATARNATKTAILLSICSLAGAVIFGMLLARGYATGKSIPYAQLAQAHVSLGLGGWVMLLIVGVSYQVVPMFQLTPGYPKWLTASLAPAIFSALLLNLMLLLFQPMPQWIAYLAEILLWSLAICFAVATLRLQSQRRRRVPDATLSFFRLGMYSLLLSALLGLTSLLSPVSIDHLGALSVLVFFLGFVMSVIHGMLYKIVPFLVWFHLFRGGVKTGVPNMKKIIPEPLMWRHLWLHGGTLLAAL